MKFKAMLAALVTIFCTSSAYSEKLLVIAPGAFLPASAYEGLVKQFRQQGRGALSVEVLEFAGSFPTRSELVVKLKSLRTKRKPANGSLDITVLGHSQGGIAAAELPSNLVNRVILLASYRRSDWFSRPKIPQEVATLTIGGTNDGLTLPKRIALDAFTMKDQANQHFYLLAGLNHFSFADGRSRMQDGVASHSLEEGHRRVAALGVAFMEGRLRDVDEEGFVEKSHEIISGYLTSFGKDANVCEDAQYNHLGGRDSRVADQISVSLTRYQRQLDYPQFILAKSALSATPDGREIAVFQYEERPPSPVDIRLFKVVSPRVVACKLRSAADVGRSLGEDIISNSCLDTNRKILAAAFDLLPADAQERVEERMDLSLGNTPVVTEDGAFIEGKGVFLEDKFLARGDQWALMSSFSFEVNDNGLLLETNSVTTPLGQPSNRFYGAHYCKVVAPSQAYSALLKFGYVAD